MSRRYFVETPLTDSTVLLSGPEAHHLLHVMRARLGESVTLFDGQGEECEARIERLGRSDVQLAIVSRQAFDRESAIEFVLGVALPKGDRQAFLVEKAVELGVASLVPLITERGVAEPVDKALERLRRQVIEASKQCGRNRLMTIAAPQAWPEFVASPAADTQRLLAHFVPTARPLSEMPVATRYLAAIGPEGGFTPAEAELALVAGWAPVSLGPRILRVETAALAIAACLAARSTLPPHTILPQLK
jgi:16S rRNA (uracil1498-N3)-methyltransferase